MNSVKIIEKTKTILSVFLIILLLNNIVSIFASIFTKAFAFTDDPQHVHIAWNIFRGKLIYKDFFEHHGALYGFFNGFIMSLLKEPASFETLTIFRIISFLTTIGIASLVFLIARRGYRSNFYALLSLTVFFSWVMIPRVAIHIRPDLLQSFFLLLGLTILIYNENYNNKIQFFSGLCFGIAILFNTKAAIFIAPILLWYFLKKETNNLKKLAWLSIGIFVPFLIICCYFSYKSALFEYLYYTIFFNLKLSSIFYAHNQINYQFWSNVFIKQDYFFSFISLLGALLALRQNQENKTISVVLFFCLIGIALALPPYFSIIFLPLASIQFSNFFKAIIEKENSSLVLKILFLITLVFYLSGRFYEINFSEASENYTQTRQDLNWVLKNSQRDEIIGTNWNSCMAYVFNEDLQFHWVRQSQFEEILGSDFWEKDYIEKLKEKKVRIFSSHRTDLDLVNSPTDNYIKNNYRLLGLHKKNNCIWVKLDS